MPKPARDPQDIEIIKEKILDVALGILYDQGFSSLSMRKIALGTKMIDPPVVLRAQRTIDEGIEAGVLDENWKEE